MAKKRVGRQAKHYKTTWGETIVGLCLRASGRFYPVGKGSPSFGSDEKLAIHRFRIWQQKQGLSNEPEPITPAVDGGVFVAADREKEKIRSLILDNPKEAAIYLNIPHLAFYPATPEKPAFTLVELSDIWKETARNDRGEKLNHKHINNTVRFWQEFIDIVAVNYLRDITGELIQKYNDAIMAEFDSGKSASYVRGRFTAVKTLVNYPLKRTTTPEIERQEARRVLDLCLSLSPPADKVKPNPISREEFQKLLSVSDVRDKAVLLLGLNAAMHLGEVANTKLAEIDFKNQTFTATRSKTAKPRVAKLWKRTIKAIQDYQATLSGKSEYVFLSARGGKVTGETLRQQLVTNRRKAKLPESVTFEGLRDAAYSIAISVDSHHAKFLAGHNTGESDKYVIRQADNPKVVACCEAIEKHFFG